MALEWILSASPFSKGICVISELSTAILKTVFSMKFWLKIIRGSEAVGISNQTLDRELPNWQLAGQFLKRDRDVKKVI